MADGTRKPIQDVKVGDQVIAADPETGERGPRVVQQVFVHQDTLIDLGLADGSSITTTANHPFWSVTDQSFKPAAQLRPGEKVLTADGTALTVTGLRAQTAHTGWAYNLAVEGIHTYYAGTTNLLVHNTCPVSFVGFTDGPPAVIPSGAAGPLATKGSGMQFRNGSGGLGLDSRVTGVRIIDGSGRHSNRIVYMNRADQTVNPFTGRTISPSDLGAHPMVEFGELKEISGLEVSAVCYVRDYVCLLYTSRCV